MTLKEDVQNRPTCSQFLVHDNHLIRLKPSGGDAVFMSQQPSFYASPFVAYHGTSQDTPLVGGKDPVSSRTLEVLWASDALRMAEQFQDGEIRKLEVTLHNPLLLSDEQRLEQFGELGHARIVDQLRQRIAQGQGDWDGVVFLDTCDGMEVADVIAIFPRPDPLGVPSVDHAVRVTGQRTFDEDRDEWVSSYGFEQANPTSTANRMRETC